MIAWQMFITAGHRHLHLMHGPVLFSVLGLQMFRNFSFNGLTYVRGV